MKEYTLKDMPPLKLDYLLRGFTGGVEFGKCKWELFEKWFIPDCITCFSKIVYN